MLNNDENVLAFCPSCQPFCVRIWFSDGLQRSRRRLFPVWGCDSNQQGYFLLLSAAGSYVALTVQGRPPGSPQIPLADSETDPAAFGHVSPVMTSPHSPGASGNSERITSPVLMGVRLKGETSRLWGCGMKTCLWAYQATSSCSGYNGIVFIWPNHPRTQGSGFWGEKTEGHCSSFLLLLCMMEIGITIKGIP